jgi:hypothetical protein
VRDEMKYVSSLELENVMPYVASLAHPEETGGVRGKRGDGSKTCDDEWAIPFESGDDEDENEEEDDEDDEDNEDNEDLSDEEPARLDKKDDFHLPPSSPSSPTSPPSPDQDSATSLPKTAAANAQPTPSSNSRTIVIEDVIDDSDDESGKDEDAAGGNDNGTETSRNHTAGEQESAAKADQSVPGVNFAETVDAAEEERRTRARLTIIRLRDELFAADPGFKRKTCANLNAEAVAYLKVWCGSWWVVSCRVMSCRVVSCRVVSCRECL